MTPIFDSLAHPTLSGKWSASTLDASFASLSQAMEVAGISRACAVGLWARDGYQHEQYYRACRENPQLVPVAGFDPHSDIREQMGTLKEMGYRAIKVHPRFSKIGFNDGRLRQIFLYAGEMHLTVFLCTYSADVVDGFPSEDPFYSIVKALQNTRAKAVLVHGGFERILEFSGLARHNSRILLDMSYTMSKLRGSSVDFDIRYICEHLDQRICVGSDFPELSPTDLRQRVEFFTEGLASEKRENIAYKNLERFLDGI